MIHPLKPLSISLLIKIIFSQPEAAIIMLYIGDGVLKMVSSVGCLPHKAYCGEARKHNFGFIKREKKTIQYLYPSPTWLSFYLYSMVCNSKFLQKKFPMYICFILLHHWLLRVSGNIAPINTYPSNKDEWNSVQGNLSKQLLVIQMTRGQWTGGWAFWRPASSLQQSHHCHQDRSYLESNHRSFHALRMLRAESWSRPSCRKRDYPSHVETPGVDMLRPTSSEEWLLCPMINPTTLGPYTSSTCPLELVILQ